MTSLKTSIKTITYLSDTGCLEIQGASLASDLNYEIHANGVYVFLLVETVLSCESPLTESLLT